MLRSLVRRSVLLCLLLGPASLVGAGEAINANCPIGKEPIVRSAGTVQHKGNTIGLCCPGCGKAFLAWEEQRKDEFVALVAAGRDQVRITDAANREPAGESDAAVVEAQLRHYPIGTCIVSGGKLGSMGDPVNYVHEGRLVRFCCAGCVPAFEESPEEFLSALDERIIAEQLGPYPLNTCVVAGGKLGSMGEPVNHIHQNRLVRFCCAGCVPGFKEDPEAFMAKLDAAYADDQRESYPLDTCVVSGAALGSMGEPVELVAGTRLVRLCCANCLPKFKKHPDEFLAKLPMN